ncbi:MAG: 50S ribosomal protein L24 [Thaumarchaeota archaeon]|nr:50S ribosomal protein L24 [Nitrososphaerota archaeon]
MATKRTKARKKYFSAPLHVYSKRVSAVLSDDLKEKYGKRSARVRKDDNVRIVRGEFKGIEGKVTKVYSAEGRISIVGVNRDKLKGGQIPIKIHASKVIMTGLNLSDKFRKSSIEGDKL